MSDRLTRRQFLKRSTLLGAGAALASAGVARVGLGLPERVAAKQPADLAIAHGPSPAGNAIAAVKALGGFERFVRKGDRVVVKPNPGGTAPPEMGICTHPLMIEAVVRECYRAGAAEVLALSRDKLEWIERNGTLAAVERAGGSFVIPNKRSLFRKVLLPKDSALKWDTFSIDVLDADVFINLPIMKHHVDTRVSGAMKNLMGITRDPIRYHEIDLDRCIAEAAKAVPHPLIIMDANYVLMTNGPMGPGRVHNAQQVIAGVDPVAVDSAGMRFFKPKPKDIRHIRLAYELGAGEMDLGKLKIREVGAQKDTGDESR